MTEDRPADRLWQPCEDCGRQTAASADFCQNCDGHEDRTPTLADFGGGLGE